MTNFQSAGFIVAILTLACCITACVHRPTDQKALDQELLEAAGNGDANQVRQLQKRGARLGAKDESGETALNTAAMEADIAVASALLEEKLDVKSLNEALFGATMNEPLVITVESKEKVQYKGPKVESFDDKYTDVVRLLLDKGAEVGARDEEGATPLLRAAGHGETGVVKLLLDRGARIEDRDNYGLTALNAAACDCPVIDMPDTLDAMKLLLEKGANIESKDNKGNTPLIHGAEWGRTENVEFLLHKGAELEAKNNEGNTALSVSAEGGGYPTVETVSFLLDHGSKIEMKNNERRTPLILAVTGDGTDQIEIVKLLLRRGANIRTRDKQGDTALSLAEKDRKPDVIEGTHSKLVKMLRSAMSASD